MTAPAHLLPPNATALERAAALAADPLPRTETGAGLIRNWQFRTPHADDLLPFLLHEYGLGPLLPYYANPAAGLIPALRWQRVRGTPDAVARGLGFVGYDGTLEEAAARRRRWNLFQTGLDRLRDAEDPDLTDIEGVTALSVAERSKFWRGFHGYDARPLEWSWNKHGDTIVADDSGVRIRTGGAKWSFGRTYDHDVAPSEANLTALGVWIPAGVNPLEWTGWLWPWTLDIYPWNAAVNDIRRGVMSAVIASLPVWVEFKTAGGAVIGYARARASHQVSQQPGGMYAVGAAAFDPDAFGQAVYIEALTGFGDGNGLTAAAAALCFNATPADADEPGRAWCGPGELTTPIAPLFARAVNIPFGRTVRERVRTVLRITA